MLRGQEYSADKFSYRLGVHEDLLIYFHFTESEDVRKFFNMGTHPMTSKRKRKLFKYVSQSNSQYLGFDFNNLGESYDDIYHQEPETV